MTISPTPPDHIPTRQQGATRRVVLGGLAAAGVCAAAGGLLLPALRPGEEGPPVFVGHARDYAADLAGLIRRGLGELGITAGEVRGKRILLKPNLVETFRGAPHINTHPAVVKGAAEALLALGAAEVLVAEGPGHNRDTQLLLEETGIGEVIREDRMTFVDLNYDDLMPVVNRVRASSIASLILPRTLARVDWVVSLAKLKTHHWAGATLAMKNLFGVMPGSVYGWPKNILHASGIPEMIQDIAGTVRPAFAIVDGIVGMEGDGPILGSPKAAGVLVMGRNLPAVDATCCRLMAIDPLRVAYLAGAAQRGLGRVLEGEIPQRGETIAAHQTPFALLDEIPAHRGLRLRPGG